jgi:hypothetical protein
MRIRIRIMHGKSNPNPDRQQYVTDPRPYGILSLLSLVSAYFLLDSLGWCLVHRTIYLVFCPRSRKLIPR